MAGAEQLRLLPEGEEVTARATFERFVSKVLPSVTFPMNDESAICLVAQVLSLPVQRVKWLYFYVAREREMLDTGLPAFSNRLLVDMNGLLGFVAFALAYSEERRAAALAKRRIARKVLPRGAQDIVSDYPEVSKRIRYPFDILDLLKEQGGELSKEDQMLLRAAPHLSEEERGVVASYGMDDLYWIYMKIPRYVSIVSFRRLGIEPYVGEVLRWNRAVAEKQLSTRTGLSEFQRGSVSELTNVEFRRTVAFSHDYLRKHKGENGIRSLLDVFDRAVAKAREQIRKALNAMHRKASQ